LSLVPFFDKPCFGTYKCWNNVKAKYPMAAECRIKRLAEDVKAGLVKICPGCRGKGVVGSTVCPACRGKGFWAISISKKLRGDAGQ
jgi:hypothetical protein